MVTGDQEERIVLPKQELTSLARDGGDDHCVEVAYIGRGTDLGVCFECDNGGDAVEAKRFAIALHRSEHDGK